MPRTSNKNDYKDFIFDQIPFPTHLMGENGINIFNPPKISIHQIEIY